MWRRRENGKGGQYDIVCGESHGGAWKKGRASVGRAKETSNERKGSSTRKRRSDGRGTRGRVRMHVILMGLGGKDEGDGEDLKWTYNPIARA